MQHSQMLFSLDRSGILNKGLEAVIAAEGLCDSPASQQLPQHA